MIGKKGKEMNLAELKNRVDMLFDQISNTAKAEDYEVIITTEDPSIGSRAGSTIKDIQFGFDWENYELRIEPVKKMFLKDRSIDICHPAVKRAYDGKDYWWCPRCQHRVGKYDHYCRTCGQLLRK